MAFDPFNSQSHSQAIPYLPLQYGKSNLVWILRHPLAIPYVAIHLVTELAMKYNMFT